MPLITSVDATLAGLMGFTADFIRIKLDRRELQAPGTKGDLVNRFYSDIQRERENSPSDSSRDSIVTTGVPPAVVSPDPITLLAQYHWQNADILAEMHTRPILVRCRWLRCPSFRPACPFSTSQLRFHLVAGLSNWKKRSSWPRGKTRHCLHSE